MPIPPLAAVVDVNVAGAVPLHIVWDVAITPALNTGATVINTEVVLTVPHVFVALRL